MIIKVSQRLQSRYTAYCKEKRTHFHQGILARNENHFLRYPSKDWSLALLPAGTIPYRFHCKLQLEHSSPEIQLLHTKPTFDGKNHKSVLLVTKSTCLVKIAVGVAEPGKPHNTMPLTHIFALQWTRSSLQWFFFLSQQRIRLASSHAFQFILQLQALQWERSRKCRWLAFHDGQAQWRQPFE